MSLTPEGMAVSGPVPLGAPTVFGGVSPVDEAQSPVDLTAEFEAADAPVEPPPAQKIESLAAVEPFDSPMEAVDIPFEDITDDTVGAEEATVTEDATATDDIDFDLGDFDGEEDVSVGVDIPGDDDLGGGIDIPEDDDLEGGDISIDIPDDDAVDIPGDDDVGFSADAMTMVPPTGGRPEPALSIEDDDAGMSLEDMTLDEEPELDAEGNPKEKFQPNEDDTLPVWTGKARTYRDPEIEKKKKETAKLNKAGQPAAKGKPPAGKPLPGKAKLPGAAKKPVTKQMKKPTGGVAPAAAKPAAGGGGNFTVFLSPPKGADKKQAAAEIIAEIQGIDMNSAVALAGKMIVPVVKGVSESEAQGVRDRFKDAGLSCRITQKR
ncbi:MAG: hypothetical protein KDB82_01570 [Planctomycetes bacterium]|nr:hypothetical protein [Planctomycetota bacterium]